MRTSPVHYIAPSAISIVPNCNGTSSDLAVTISRDARIKVYSPRAGIDKTRDGEYQEWTLTGRNRRLADSTKPYTIYARLSALDNTAYLIFAPMTPADDGEYMGLWTQKYSWVTTDGLYVFGKGSDWEEQRTKMNCIFVRLGDVSLPDANNQRTVTLDTGILGTYQFNDEWALRPDELPLRIELGCTINDEDAGTTPYVYWGQSLVLTAMLTEGWTGTDIQRFDRWEIIRNSGDNAADNAWNYQEVEGQDTLSPRLMPDGQITLNHARGDGDDFNGAVAVTFTILAVGHNADTLQSEVLRTATINIMAETVEKYELSLSESIVSYDPQTQNYSPAGGVDVGIRATDQRGEVFDMTRGQIANALLVAEYAPVGSSSWTALTFSGSSQEAATANIDTTAFASQQSVNVRLMRRIIIDGQTDEKELARTTIAFVRDGEDSKEREWIYRLNSNAGYNSTTGTANGQAVSGQTGGVDNCLLTDDFVPTGWSDDPTGVSQPGDVEWESWRDYDDENHRWGVFHTPVIHNRYAEDGKSISKKSETATYQVSDNGTTTPSGSWQATKQAAVSAWNTAHGISGSEWAKGTYMWTRTIITWTDGITDTATTLYQAERNPDDGQPGMSVVIDSQNVQYSKQAAGNLDPSALTYGAYPASLGKGDWLYSRTTIVYKTSGGASAGTTVTYSVSYIGTDGDNGAGISGITEHYMASANATGEAAPTEDANEWGTNPMPSDWNGEKRYLWNYEKIAKVDKNGNTTYERTPASVVAIFTKGIDSITNYYLTNNIASGITKQNYQNYQWSTSITPTTEGAPYLWNYEVVAYTDGSTPTMTDPHVIGHYGKDGTSPWIADLDNEMDSVACDVDGNAVSENELETNVSISKGNTRQAISSIVCKIDGYTIGTEYTQQYNPTQWFKQAINTTTGNVKIYVRNGVSLGTPVKVSITVTATIDGTSVSRDLQLVINGVLPGADGAPATVYNLMPSMAQVSVGRDSNDGYTPRYNTLTVGYTKSVGGTLSSVTEATGNIDGRYRIFFRRRVRGTGVWESTWYYYNNATYKRYLVVTSGYSTSGFDAEIYDKVEFVIYRNTSASSLNTIDNTMLADRETVPVVSDGPTGEPGPTGMEYQRRYKSTNSGTNSETPTGDSPSGWSTTPTAVTEATRYRWMIERSRTNGNSAWSAWSSPVIDYYLSEDGRSISIKGQAKAVIAWGESLPATANDGDAFLMNNDDADSINVWDDGLWDSPTVQIGDGYLVNGHLWLKVAEQASTSEPRWSDAGQMQGPKGDDGVSYSIETDPSTVVFNTNAVGDFVGPVYVNITAKSVMTVGQQGSSVTATGFYLCSRLLEEIDESGTRQYSAWNEGTLASSAMRTVLKTYATRTASASTPRTVAVDFCLSTGTYGSGTIVAQTTVPVMLGGRRGVQGSTGKMFFSMGNWDPATEYELTEERVPMVFRESSTWNPALEVYGSYWYLTAHSSLNDDPNTTTDVWTEAVGYGVVITQGLFALFAKLGGFIISGDFFYSQHGTLFYNDSGTIREYDATIWEAGHAGKAYVYFDDNDPMVSVMPTAGNYKFRPIKVVNAATGEEWMGQGKVHVDADGNLEIKESIFYHRVQRFEITSISSGQVFWTFSVEGDSYQPGMTPHFIADAFMVVGGNPQNRQALIGLPDPKDAVGMRIKIVRGFHQVASPLLLHVASDEETVTDSSQETWHWLNGVYDPLTQELSQQYDITSLQWIELTVGQGLYIVSSTEGDIGPRYYQWIITGRG